MELHSLYDVIVYILNSIGIYEPIQNFFESFGAELALKIIIYAIEGTLLFALIGILLLVLTYMERKELADFQARLGPMVTGGGDCVGRFSPWQMG